MNDPQTEQITITVDRTTALRFRAADDDARAKSVEAFAKSVEETTLQPGDRLLKLFREAREEARANGLTEEEAADFERETLESL